VHPFWKPHPNAPLSSKGTAGIVANIRVHRNAVLHNSFPHQFNDTKRLTFFSPAISVEKIPLCPAMFAQATRAMATMI
jgi:hypothetical protein